VVPGLDGWQRTSKPMPKLNMLPCILLHKDPTLIVAAAPLATQHQQPENEE